METLFKILLALHIIGGSLALICGYSAMWVKRGGPRHRQLGQIYLYGMATVLVTGFPMSIIHPNIFLFGIVFFTAYFVWCGRRAALHREGSVETQDWVVLGIFAVGAALAMLGVIMTLFTGRGLDQTQQITAAIFAIIALSRAFGDWRIFRAGPIIGRDRIARHLVNMCAALIATTTAVAVTMFAYLSSIPPIVAWLGPTLIITPLIFRWSAQVAKGNYDMG